jgi:hypothetical protein
MKRLMLAPAFITIALFSALLPLGGTGRALASTAPLYVKGTVKAVTADSLSIIANSGQAMTFRLSATIIYEKYGQPAQLADVKVGLYVEVKYHVEADGTLKAKKVKIELHTAAPTATPKPTVAVPKPTVTVPKSTVTGRPSTRPIAFQLEGTDMGVTAGAVVVRVRGLSEGRTSVRTLVGRRLPVQVARGAAILLDNHPARLGALAPGDSLHITGTVANGAFTARRIIAQHPAHR